MFVPCKRSFDIDYKSKKREKEKIRLLDLFHNGTSYGTIYLWGMHTQTNNDIKLQKIFMRFSLVLFIEIYIDDLILSQTIYQFVLFLANDFSIFVFSKIWCISYVKVNPLKKMFEVPAKCRVAI